MRVELPARFAELHDRLSRGKVILERRIKRLNLPWAVATAAPVSRAVAPKKVRAVQTRDVRLKHKFPVG